MRTPAPTAIRRPRRALALAAALALLAATLPAAAAVYKWVDPQGRIHYSDRPPPPEGKLLSVDTSATHPSERASAPSPAPRSATPPGPAAGPATGPAATPEAMARLKQSVDSDVANARTDQCKQARDKYQTYVQSRRLYKEGPNKERIYLSDQELETERLQAKHEVDELCAGN
ncbi:MAG: DUF4124 domain-containing protein [Proteobacteria bacterium]|nr:DUF4124 domain-containing protein [Pseudomonadota bacterium]